MGLRDPSVENWTATAPPISLPGDLREPRETSPGPGRQSQLPAGERPSALVRAPEPETPRPGRAPASSGLRNANPSAHRGSGAGPVGTAWQSSSREVSVPGVGSGRIPPPGWGQGPTVPPRGSERGTGAPGGRGPGGVPRHRAEGWRGGAGVEWGGNPGDGGRREMGAPAAGAAGGLVGEQEGWGGLAAGSAPSEESLPETPEEWLNWTRQLAQDLWGVLDPAGGGLEAPSAEMPGADGDRATSGFEREGVGSEAEVRRAGGGMGDAPFSRGSTRAAPALSEREALRAELGELARRLADLEQAHRGWEPGR